MEEEIWMETEDARSAHLSSLPEEVIAYILSLTSPFHACRSSAVSRIFNAAAQSDIVWDTFLPTNWDVLISKRKSNEVNVDPISSSKKDIFFFLCNNPVLIDDGKKSLSLEKWGGKKCIMLGARDLLVVWSEDSFYWKWQQHPDSRFKEVVMLLNVWWLEIRGRISCKMLSPRTIYGVYLVFKMTPRNYYGFDIVPADVNVKILGNENNPKSVCLDPFLGNPRPKYDCVPFVVIPRSKELSRLEQPKERNDGWFEIEMGEFESGDGDDEVEMSLLEGKGASGKIGLIVEGIEIRPKSSGLVL